MVLKKLEACLATSVKKTVAQVNGTIKTVADDDDLVVLAHEVIDQVDTAPAQLGRILRPNFGLRALLVAGCIAVIAGIALFVRESKLALELTTWKDLLGLLAQGGQVLVVLVPMLLALVLLESRIRRRKLLKRLETLAQFIHAVYLVQFNLDPTDVTKDKKAQIQYLDCCCALMVLIRVAATSFAKGVSDSVVLERVARIGQSSENAHRNLLLKIGLAQSNTKQ